MPRRMSQSRDELRRAAIVGARAIVDGEGLAGLNVRRLAGLMGCSVGTIYNLFLDLDDVVLHLSAEVLDEMRGALFAPRLPEGSVDALVEIARRYIRFARSHRRLFSMVFEHEPVHDRATPDWQVERITGLVGPVRDLVGPALGSGADAAALAAATDVLWASVHGIATLALDDKLGFVTGTDPEALAERLVRTYLAGAH